jgi:hypothetical protein
LRTDVGSADISFVALRFQKESFPNQIYHKLIVSIVALSF